MLTFRNRRAPRARAIAAIAVAAMFVPSLAAAGAASAASDNGIQLRIGASVSVSTGHGDAAAKQCFDTFPNCTSTNPTATFRIVSNGDTSSCTFQYTTAWGDGKTEVQSFPGGADGATLARFIHTYDRGKPQTWTVTVTGAVTSGSCTANGGTLMFTLLPNLGVAGVRFAADSGLMTTTPGLPVVKDDGGKLVQRDGFGPYTCSGLTASRSYDYLDCGTPVPTGSVVKNWPVIYAAGEPLTLNEVGFAENGQIPNPQVSATATVSGSGSASLSLSPTSLNQTKTASGYTLTGSGLTFTGALPSVPGKDTLTITWTVTDVASGILVKTVTSSHVIYVTAGKYVEPSLPSGENAPFETAIDVGTVAAAGQSGVPNVFNAIWKKFTSLSIKHPELDPATGAVTYGNALTYYNNGFNTISAGYNGDRRGCTDAGQLILYGTGHCGAWAEFLALVLAYQGITAHLRGLGNVTGTTGFNPGPDPAGGTAISDAYMLVGKNLWQFTHPTATGSYSYRDKLTVTAGGAIDVSGTEVTYQSTAPQAQGQIVTPPPFFTDGDHAIDEVSLPGGNVWVDPSYGDPSPPMAPFQNVRSYEPNALAGFAVIFKQEGTKLVPLKATYIESEIATACQNATCYFQAFKGI